MPIFIVDANTNSISEFFVGRVYSVMIIGYEKLQKFKSELVAGQVDLIICDEGHRLKSSNTIPSEILNQLKTARRVILTGTPVQNNLDEFVELINFVNPGTLKYSKSQLDGLSESMIQNVVNFN